MTFSSRQLALMSMLIALNVAVGGLVHIMKLPIFLDAIGTILAAVLLGLVPAIIVGVLTFLVASAVLSPVYVYFVGTQAIIAAFIYACAAHLRVFRSVTRTVLAGIALGVVAGVASAPIIVFVFGGVAGSGRDLVTATLLAAGQQVYKAVLLSGIASEPIDKTLQMLAALFILKSLPRRLLNQFGNPILQKNGLLEDVAPTPQRETP